MKHPLLLLLLVSGLAQSAGIQKWIDEDGVVHYGDTPPLRVQAEPVSVTRPPSNPGKPLPRLNPDGDKAAATASAGAKKPWPRNAKNRNARAVSAGDVLTIHRNGYEFVVTILGLKEKRGPAREAVSLYEESEESIRRRQEIADQRRLERQLHDGQRPAGRPGKRDRRLIRSFTGKY